MKSKFLIIIGIIIILGSVSTFVIVDYFDKLSTESFSNLPPQFQAVLDYCEEKKTGNDMNLIGLSYYNDTHYIDNNKCEWKSLENYPDTNIQCIPGRHHHIDDDMIYLNHTHTFDNNKCEWIKTFSWEEEWDKKSQSTTSLYVEKMIPTLEDFKKFISDSPDIDTIFFRFGEPVDDIGSGIHIYVYKLNDLTEIRIGYVEDILYVKHVDVDGKILEELFVKKTGPESTSEDNFDIPEVKLFLEKYSDAKIQSDRINESGFHFKQYAVRDSLPGGSVWLFLVKNLESGEMDNVLSCPPNQYHDVGYAVRGSENIVHYLQNYDCLSDDADEYFIYDLSRYVTGSAI